MHVCSHENYVSCSAVTNPKASNSEESQENLAQEPCPTANDATTDSDETMLVSCIEFCRYYLMNEFQMSRLINQCDHIHHQFLHSWAHGGRVFGVLTFLKLVLTGFDPFRPVLTGFNRF